MTSADDRPERRDRLLEAAIAVFLRYGFRKTSMDEVARAAQISRQGLYLHYKTKEDLFIAGLEYLLQSHLHGVDTAFADESAPIESRLCSAFDAWMGRYLGTVLTSSTDSADLLETSGRLAQDTVLRAEASFQEKLTKAVRSSGLAAAYKVAGLSAQKVAEIVYATARGLKHATPPPDRAKFLADCAAAMKALCLPLRLRG